MNKIPFFESDMRLTYFILFLSITVFYGCAPTEKTKEDFIQGKKLSILKDKKLNEISGLACSIRNPGLLWAHNDAGNDAEVFLIDQECKIKQRVILEGIKNRDWEDIAVGPGPDSTKSYVYVGDIGDNNGVHELKFIYRFEEPLLIPDEKRQSITAFDTIIFRLPASARMDTEALFIDPNSKDLYVVSKREQPVHVYQLKYPYNPGDTVDAIMIAALPFTQIVAADLSADGHDLLMKNYTQVYYWKNTSGKTIPKLLKDTPVEVPYITEPQGESVAWARDNSGFYTISESKKTENVYLFFYQRK